MQELIKFKGIKMEFDLECQMPMIHFQSDQLGATLRATEVKPKLDAYLMEMEEGLTKEELDYKMQITLNESGQEIIPYKLYYGNTGDGGNKYCLFTDPTVIILCFKEKIRKLLEKHIINFFLVTNFGTMQNKGFGSFVPKDWLEEGNLTNAKKKEVAQAYETLTGGTCYAMHFTEKDRDKRCVEMADAIKLFYSVMKSGANYGPGRYSRSYIYQYGHRDLELGNEKAWMKKNEIAPAMARPGSNNKHEHENGSSQDCYYLRAFLGVGEQISYGDAYNEKGYIAKRPGVSVKIKSKEFERVSSPIYFKVIRSVVFVAAFEVDEKLYGAEFTFSSNNKTKNGKNPSKTIQVPGKDKGKKPFKTHEFLASYVEYYNRDLNKKIKKDNPDVVEVKTNG